MVAGLHQNSILFFHGWLIDPTCMPGNMLSMSVHLRQQASFTQVAFVFRMMLFDIVYFLLFLDSIMIVQYFAKTMSA